MPNILEKDIQMEGLEESDETNTIDITTELSSKYNHIMNYYHDELYEPFDDKNMKRKTGEHETLRKDNDEGFSIIKEMFVKALGLNIQVGEKRRQQVVKTTNISENNKMTVNSHPAIIQKIGNFHEEDDNDAQHFGDDFNRAPLESKSYICSCCNSTFEDKGSIILHLNSHRFMRNAKKARPLVKRITGKIKSNSGHRKQYGHIENIAKKINNSKISENTKVVKDNVIRFYDENNATTNHEATQVSDNNLVISDDRQKIQIFHNKIEVTDNFKGSNDDCPIHLAEDFDLKQNRLDSERNFICYHCEKSLEEKGSLIFHLLAHKVTIDKTSREVINDTKQERKKNEIVKANDLKPKSANEQNERNIRTGINKKINSNDSKITSQAREITRRMHLAVHKLINDRNTRDSKIIATDNEAIQEHNEIENVHDPKVNEDGKTMRPDHDQQPEKSNLKTNQTEDNKILPNRTKYSLLLTSDSELNRLIVSDIQMEGFEETDETNTIDITTELSPKYNHIMNYYHDELYEPFDDKNMKRKTGEHEKLRKDNDEGFSMIKEMFVKALGLNIQVGEKRRHQVVNTTNNSENNQMTVDSHPAIIQKIGNFHEEDDNDAQHFGDDFNRAPLESKTYICSCCNSTFEDKGSIILHLNSHRFMRNAKKAGRLVERIAGKIKSNSGHRKQYGHIENIAKKISNWKSSEKTKVVKDNVIRFYDENNASANQETTKVSDNNLVISLDRQNIQIFNDEIEVTGNFKNSTDDCPIHLAEDFDLKQNRLDSERNFICYHCEKSFEEKGLLIFHLLAHKVTIVKKSTEVINQTKQECKKNEIVKANDAPKRTNEQNERNIRTDINNEIYSNDSKIATQARVITRKRLAAQKLINDGNIRESKIITKNNETIQKHKEIENVHDPKVNEEGKTMRPDRDDRSSNDRENAKQTNGVMTRTRAEMINHGNIHNDGHRNTTQYGHIQNIAKRRNHWKSSEKTKVVKNNVNRFYDENNAPADHEATKVSRNNLVISDDRQNIQIFSNEIEVTDNFKDYNDDCPIHLAEYFNLKQNQLDSERNFICYHCEKTFDEKGSLIFHLLAHKLTIDKKYRELINGTKKERKKNEIGEANDLKPTSTNEQNERNIRTDINNEIYSNDSKIATQARVIIRRMHLAAQKLINNRNIRESKMIPTDNETIQDHKEIENLHDPKVNEDGKTMRPDHEDRSSNNGDNAKLTNGVMTRTRAQTRNHHIHNSNKKSTLHLNYHRFMSNAKKAGPLDKITAGKMKSNDRHRNQYSHIANIAKKINNSKTSKKTKVVNDNFIRFDDENNAPANHEATKVSGNNLVISDDRQNIQIFNYEIEVTDNFKDSNDDCPIHLAEDFDLKQNQLDSERNFICYHCEKTFQEKGSLIFHLLAHKVTIEVNEDGKTIRPDCEDRSSNDRDNAKQTNGGMTRTRAQKRNHGNIHNSNKKSTTNNAFECNDCGRKFKIKALLITHTKNHSNNSTSKAKKKEKTLKPHITGMNDRKSSKLKEKGIKSTNNLEKHTKKPKFCTLCKYRTPYASRLVRHSRVHITSNKCEHCKKIFRKRHDLKLHLRTHSGDKPFRCQCGSSFARVDTLSRHLKTHTGEKSYKCSLCPSKFKLPSGLKRHLKIHAEKTYKCTTCASTFSDGSSLKRHMGCHIILKKPYSCESCKYSSAHSYDLKRHVKTCKGRLRASCTNLRSDQSSTTTCDHTIEI